MEKYNGNQKGFIYVSCNDANQKEVFEKYLEPLAKEGISFWWADGFDSKEEKNLARASAALVFLTNDYVKEEKLRDTITASVKKNKPVLCVYLEDVELDATLSMQTEAQQALFVNKFNNDEEFIEELKKAAIFDNLQVSEQQKKKQKNRTFAAVAAAVIILIAAIVIIRPLLSSGDGSNAMEALDLKGLSKEDLEAVEEIYVVGGEALDHDAAARYEDGDKTVIVYEYSDDDEETTPAGSIADLSGMDQLVNLTTLQLSGQQITSVADLGGLENLHTIILSCNPLESLDGIEDLELEVLDISYTDVSEIPEGMHVREINADGSKLSKVPDFGGLSDVEFYAGDPAGNTQLSDISNIGTAANYADFHIICSNVDIGQVVDGLKGITVENLALNKLRTEDLTELSGLDASETTNLGIGGSDITSLDGIEHFGSLTDLQIEYCDHLTDLSVLNDMKSLERVTISDNMTALADQLDDRIEIIIE